MWEQRGLLGGCWKPQTQPHQAAAPLDHQSAIRTANSLCVWLCVRACVRDSDWVYWAQHIPLFYDAAALISLSLVLFGASAVSQVRPEPIRGSLVQSISRLSLSLPVCLSLEPSLSALTLCRLTALPPNQALKGNFKRLTRQKGKKKKKTPEKQIPQCRQDRASPFHSF